MAAAGLGGSIIGAVGSNSAANAQADAANQAANLQFQSSQNALNFQREQYQNSLQMLNPYLQTGYGALGMLRRGLGIGGPMPQGFNMNPSGGANFPGGLSFNPNPALIDGSKFQNPLTIDGSNSFMLPQSGTLSTNALLSGNAPTSSTTLPNGGFGVDRATGPEDSGIGMPGNNPGGDDPSGPPTGVDQAITGKDASLTVPADGTQDNSGQLGFGSLLAPFTEQFQAPTDVTEQNDPGYQFRLQQGQQAIQNSAAARGGLLSGGTAKALADYNQNAASGEYGNVYNRRFNEFTTRYNQYVNNQTNQFNKLAAISGMGQTSANNLSTAGLATAGQVGNTLLTSAGQIGQDLNNAGAARGSGYVGIANSLSGGLNNLGSLALLSHILGQQGGGGLPNLAGMGPGDIGF